MENLPLKLLWLRLIRRRVEIHKVAAGHQDVFEVQRAVGSVVFGSHDLRFEHQRGIQSRCQNNLLGLHLYGFMTGVNNRVMGTNAMPNISGELENKCKLANFAGSVRETA